MKIQGKITKILSNNLAEVVCEPNPACAKCKGCQMGSSGEVFLQARNQAGAKIDDRVEVEIAEAEGIKAALLVFILPVMGLLVGYFIGMKFSNSESAGIIGAFIFMALTFLFLNLYDRYLKNKNECKAFVTKVLC